MRNPKQTFLIINKKILDLGIKFHTIPSFRADVKTYISLVTQISKTLKDKFAETLKLH